LERGGWNVVGRGLAGYTCQTTHKCQVINLRNCCILLVDLFESYNDARICERQKKKYFVMVNIKWLHVLAVQASHYPAI